MCAESLILLMALYGCSYNAAAAAASVRRPYFPVVLWESGEAIIAPSCTTAFPIHKGSTQ